MTVRSDTRRVYPATLAEVILHDNFEVACFRQSGPRHVSRELLQNRIVRETSQVYACG